MKKMMCVLLLSAGLSGCIYEGYAVRPLAPVEPTVSKDEVERLSGAGVSEPVIVELIDKRGAAKLSPDDLVALKKSGVPDALVQKMIASERNVPMTHVEGDVYIAPSSAYYYYDYPYYPYYSSFSYGIGWGWGWGYSRSYPRGYMGVRVYR